MAIAAQIEANRRNSLKSTGPRTEEGKSKSRMNALDHGCRANVLVLPTEEFGQYENELQGWRRSLQPRNPAEEFLVQRLVGLGILRNRIDRAHTARLRKRIALGLFDEADSEQEKVVALTQRLFPDACLPGAFQKPAAESKSGRQAHDRKRGDMFPIDPDDPELLIIRLQRTLTGCRWLLEKWEALRVLVEQGTPWLGSDKLKAVRLLGRRPTDAHDWTDVAQVYMATHVLAGTSGDPFQEILDELPPEQTCVYAKFLKMRGYETCMPENCAAAKQMLLDIIDRAVEPLEQKADQLAEIAEQLAPCAADRLSWDDTPDGERLRRYEMRCSSTWFRLFDLLFKVRNDGGRLDFAAVASIGQPVRVSRIIESNSVAPAVASVTAAPVAAEAEPAAPGEANIEPQNAPTEANRAAATAPTEANRAPATAPTEANRAAATAPNEPDFGVHQVPGARHNQAREYRIDTPHVGHQGSRSKLGGKSTGHPVLDRVLGGRESTLLNLSGIFDTR
jgi:hypothetical protein